MRYSKAVRSDSAPRADIYTTVTNKIVADLEAGIVPWARPWGKTGTSSALPANATTGRAYSGINVLILWGAAMTAGYSSNGWLTFNQCRDAGGNVRKGEKGTTIVYASTFVPEAEREKGDDARAVAFLKSFCVFNVEQCEGLRNVKVIEPMTERQIHDGAEALIEASGIEFRIGGNDAFYSPSHDFVQVPPQTAYFEQINYYRTVMHELSHNAAIRIMPRAVEMARFAA